MSAEDGAVVVPQTLGGRVWAFVTWHKKKLIALGSVTVLGVTGYYYAKRMLMDGMRQVEEIGRGIQEKMMETQHRQNEQKRLREECASMLVTFTPPLRTTVKKMTDPKPVTERLKTVRMERKNSNVLATPEAEEEVKQLWDELKVLSLTRLFGSVYSLALLNAVLQIQLHVLGRYGFEEAAEHRKEASRAMASRANGSVPSEPPTIESREPSGISRKVRERFLFSGSDHLMSSGVGMQILVKRVHDCIKETSKNWLMGTDAKVTRTEVVDMINTIRKAIEDGPGEAQEEETKRSSLLHLSEETQKWIVKCLVPRDEDELFEPDRELDEKQNQFCREMLMETLDMIESPMFALVAEQSFDSLFNVLQQDVQTRAFEPYKGDEQDPNAEEQFLLTKVIVNLKQVAGDVLSESSPGPQTDASEATGIVGENDYDRALQSITSLAELCTAVFQQGVEQGGVSPLDAFGLDALGLGDLGINDSDLQSLAGLLGGLSGGPGASQGGIDEAELLKLMSSIGGDPANGGQLGGIDDEQLMQALQSTMSSK